MHGCVMKLYVDGVVLLVIVASHYSYRVPHLRHKKGVTTKPFTFSLPTVWFKNINILYVKTKDESASTPKSLLGLIANIYANRQL